MACIICSEVLDALPDLPDPLRIRVRPAEKEGHATIVCQVEAAKLGVFRGQEEFPVDIIVFARVMDLQKVPVMAL